MYDVSWLWTSAVQTANEIHEVADIVLRQAVIDPGRHGGALHAVEDRLEQAPIGDAVDEMPCCADCAGAAGCRASSGPCRRPCGRGSRCSAAGRSASPALDRSGDSAHRIRSGTLCGLSSLTRLFHEVVEDVSRARLRPGRRSGRVAPGRHRGSGDAIVDRIEEAVFRLAVHEAGLGEIARRGIEIAGDRCLCRRPSRRGSARRDSCRFPPGVMAGGGVLRLAR